MIEQELIEFCSKSCKNNCHNLCNHQWKGLGFQIVCNCDCHRKKVLAIDESLPNTINLPHNRSSKEYEL